MYLYMKGYIVFMRFIFYLNRVMLDMNVNVYIFQFLIFGIEVIVCNLNMNVLNNFYSEYRYFK